MNKEMIKNMVKQLALPLGKNINDELYNRMIQIAIDMDLSEVIVDVFDTNHSIETIAIDLEYEASIDKEVDYLKEYYIYENGYFNDLRIFSKAIAMTLFGLVKESLILDILTKKIEDKEFDLLAVYAKNEKTNAYDELVDPNEIFAYTDGRFDMVKIEIDREIIFIKKDYLSTSNTKVDIEGVEKVFNKVIDTVWW